MFGRATITLGIGPHFQLCSNAMYALQHSVTLYRFACVSHTQVTATVFLPHRSTDTCLVFYFSVIVLDQNLQHFIPTGAFCVLFISGGIRHDEVACCFLCTFLFISGTSPWLSLQATQRHSEPLEFCVHLRPSQQFQVRNRRLCSAWPYSIRAGFVRKLKPNPFGTYGTI